jgi:TolB-like protein/Flp pilus assembly protein TadD
MYGRANQQDAGTAGGSPRLDSWKEIASYLKRGVRTVRRWERQEGLPVHRHVHSKQATVYAFAQEIDDWLQGRSAEEGADRVHVVHAPHASAWPGSETDRKEQRTRPAVIAILPLRFVGGDPDYERGERFADGLTDELIMEIGHACPNRLRVIALTSVMQYKQSPRSIAQIGKELSADYILEGAIRRDGQRVRLTARLIAARDQTQHIWANSYEILLPPILSLQQALARQVADSLSVKLDAAPQKRRHVATALNFAAHSTYIEGRSHFLPTPGDSTKSIEQLNLAIVEDPKFARSYAQLALAYLRRLFWDYPPIITCRRIEENASKALKLDPKLALAHSMLAAFHLFSARAWSKAERETRQAIKLNPSDAWAHVVRAAYHLVVGELQEAIEELKSVRQLDPQSAETGLWFANFAYFARRYDLAIEHCQGLLQIAPSSARVHMSLAFGLALTGEYALALSHCEKARGLGDTSGSQVPIACAIYALVGERDLAERLLQELVVAEEHQYTRYFFLAVATVSLDKDQETLDWLEKAYKQRDPLLIFLRTDPMFERVAGLSGFRDLLRRIGFPEVPKQLAATQAG